MTIYNGNVSSSTDDSLQMLILCHLQGGVLGIERAQGEWACSRKSTYLLGLWFGRQV